MDITGLLRRVGAGDAAAERELIPLVYGELKRLAAGHLKGHWNVSLSATALVHEAFLRIALIKDAKFEDRAHFFGIASRLMRNVLVDLVRQTNAAKRGASLTVRLDEAAGMEATAGCGAPDDVLVLDQALSALSEPYPRQAKFIEMRYFGGMTVQEISSATGLSTATVERDLRFGQAWLRREMGMNKT